MITFLRRVAKAIFFLGSARYCPVCEKSYRVFKGFASSQATLRPDVRCPGCLSLERDRFSWLLLKKLGLLNPGIRMLHFAPEQCLRHNFKTLLGDGYITADLNATNVMLKLDITAMDLPGASFDFIYCSHVLEHVENDLQAMRELRRVLRPDGIALLNVPIFGAITYEDSSIKDPEGRLKAFGQKDHVRKYGQDFVQRLQASGFSVHIAEVSEVASEDEAQRMRIVPITQNLFVCRQASN